MSDNCPFGENVSAFCAGELTPAELAEFESHLAACADCQTAVESIRRLLGRLRALPKAECTRDLAPLILEKIRQPEALPVRWEWRRAVAVAAVFAIVAVSAASQALSHRQQAAPAVSTPTITQNDPALDWIVRAQEPDGSWSAERWGGQRNYAPALNALPLLALVTAARSTPERETAIARAVASLLAAQNPQGGFGRVFQGAPYNHSITTFALLQAWQKNPHVAPKAALDAAVAELVRRQRPEGGWGYLYGLSADSSITQWHLQALELAAKLGWSEARPAFERGNAWLAAYDPARDPASEPADSTSVLLASVASRSAQSGALDFYRVYFASAALKQADTPTARRRLAGLQGELLRRQITEGEETGSWAPDDQWGRVGGRLYSTALASLTLEKR